MGRTVARSRRGTVEHAGGGEFVRRVGGGLLAVARRHRPYRIPHPVGRRHRPSLDLIPSPGHRYGAGATAGGGAVAVVAGGGGRGRRRPGGGGSGRAAYKLPG